MQQNQPTIQQLKELSSQLPEKLPYLKMLILFGSRATGETHDDSDWDFATLYDPNLRKSHIANNAFKGFEVPLILDQIFGINSDIIDVVELNTCPWLLAHFIARDGILIYEKDAGGFEYFRLTSLRSESELKQFRQDQRQLIDMELQKWGV
jgi:predicted nucleotidyltransferase